MTEQRIYDSGTQKLIDDLLLKPQCWARDEILERARKLRYHSFSDNGYDLPEIELVKHLMRAGYKDLAQHVADGKYDQPPEESRKWAEETEEGRKMTAMVKANPELQAQLTAAMKALEGHPRIIIDDGKGSNQGRGTKGEA